jgi:predicted dehydrogenase
MDKAVLIIGYGKMGHIYSKYLDEFGIVWAYYDPYCEGGIDDLSEIVDYTHVLISTPPENHYTVYKQIKGLGFKGQIYIDKPTITSQAHMDIFEDDKVFCGMTERYNPVVGALKSLLNVKELTSIKFSRYSTVPDNMKTPVLFDLGIHDLDLYLYLLNFNDFPKMYDVFEKSKTCYILTQQSDVLSIFEWSHESHRRERKIVVLQKDIVYEVDLIDQTLVSHGEGSVIQNLYVEKGPALKNIMRNFLDNEKCNAKLSHMFMFDIIKALKGVIQ